MVSRIYSKIEAKIDQIDHQIISLYEAKVRSLYAKKYEEFSNCLDKIPQYNEEEIQKCSNTARLRDIDIQKSISSSKHSFYTCIDESYSKYQDGKDKNKEQKLDERVNSCLQNFQNDVMHIFENFDKTKFSK